MKLVLDRISASRPGWSLAANGIFSEGIHLVSGDVGSGKSTLALIMADLFMPEQGTCSRENLERIMLSFQFPEFHITGLTVADECASWNLAPDDVLALAGLHVPEKTSPLSLSRGELKRLHLACILSRQYDLLLLDEPFSSLDCREKERLCSQISSRNAGITILFTHEQTFFPRVDHLWEIVGGTLVDCGNVPGAFSCWQHAPPLVKKMVEAGHCPANLTQKDLLEAACRTRVSD